MEPDRNDGVVLIPRISSNERRAVSELPSLSDRIDKMGLSQEYAAFRDRYQGWRTGGSSGARGELGANDLLQQHKGFGFWYPSTAVWSWRRTLSYWIAVTFFEGSVFFTISSFMFCYPERFGSFTPALTTFGYVAGQINYSICTYFMCLETINLSIKVSDTEEGSNCEQQTVSDDGEENFRYNPFLWNAAVAKLKSFGLGPWPYYVAINYFIGSSFYLVGMSVGLMTFLSKTLVVWVPLITFFIGGIGFVLGAVAECIENQVFTSFRPRNAGWCAAILDLLGSSLFWLGSMLGLCSGLDYWASFTYGVGAVFFSLAGGVLIIMWKDEQFGLSFLSALNNLGGPNGQPLVMQVNSSPVTSRSASIAEAQTFSGRGASFIMIYILAAVVGVYNFMVDLSDLRSIHSYASCIRVIVTAFNALLPAVFAHLLLGLSAAIVKPPKQKPFRQLYFACRFLQLLMVVIGTAQLTEKVVHGSNAD